MFEASGVVSSWRGAEMFEVHENNGVERVDVRSLTQCRQLKRDIGIALMMCG